LDRGGDYLVDAALIGDVEAFDAFRVLDKTIVGTRGVAERGDNVVATPRERKRSCEAEARAAAGDQDNGHAQATGAATAYLPESWGVVPS
jgi:hypothetical protein